jgi:hypothetical protein
MGKAAVCGLGSVAGRDSVKVREEICTSVTSVMSSQNAESVDLGCLFCVTTYDARKMGSSRLSQGRHQARDVVTY